MTRGVPSRTSLLVAAVLAAGGGAAWADEAAVARRVERRGPPRARIDLGYAVSFRDDRQSVDLVDVSSKGLSPTHLRLDGVVYFGDLPVGLAARVNWERFTLTGADLAGSPVTLTADGLAAAGGLAVRLDLRGWLLEGAVGYGYQGLPIVDAAGDTLATASAAAHGPMLAVRFGLPTGSWILPDVHVGALPYAFADTPAGSGSGWTVDAGAGLGFGGLPLGGLEWSAVVGYDFSYARLGGGGASDYAQAAHRVGLALRMTIPGGARTVEIAPPTGPGRILGKLLDADGKPVARHVVEVAGRDPVRTDDEGAFVVRKAGPGSVALRAPPLPGLKPAARTVEVPPEQDVPVELRLLPPSGPGTIRGVLFDKPGDPSKRVPLAGATVEAAGLSPVTTDENGAFVVAPVGPGLVPLKLSAKGYVRGEEVVSVAPEAEAKVELSLVAEKAKPLATLRGLVRAVGGRPLAARLTIAEAKLTVNASAAGEFKVAVPGGRYVVKIDAPGYRSQTKVVEVADGDQAIFNIDMHSAR